MDKHYFLTISMKLKIKAKGHIFIYIDITMYSLNSKTIGHTIPSNYLQLNIINASKEYFLEG